MNIKGLHTKEGKYRKTKFVSLIISWEKQNYRAFPWRKDRSPYNIFIAEVLLKRTTSKAAETFYEHFLRIFPDIHSLYEADLANIEEILRPVGLYKQRSKGLKEAATYVVENYGGSFPTNYDDLLKIPHIGPYTAGAIMSFAYGKPAPIVDSNVVRVLGRVFSDSLPLNFGEKQIKELADKLIPEKDHEYFNWGLVDLGALVCTYRKCCSEVCPVKSLCGLFHNSDKISQSKS